MATIIVTLESQREETDGMKFDFQIQLSYAVLSLLSLVSMAFIHFGSLFVCELCIISAKIYLNVYML